MKLRLKDEYKEWSVALKHIKKIKLSNLDPFFYDEVYKSNPEFFVLEKEVIKKEVVDIKGDDEQKNK